METHDLSITNHAVGQYIDRVLNHSKVEVGSDLHNDVVDILYSVNDTFEMFQQNGKYKISNKIYGVIKDNVMVYNNEALHSNYIPLPDEIKKVKKEIIRRNQYQKRKRFR
jgi:hypothetical protein